MDIDQVRKLAKQYAEELRREGWREERTDPDQVIHMVLGTSQKRVMQHLLWLCLQLAENTLLSEAKAMRWLGFVQGAFWILGRRTISEMKDHNRNKENR